MVLGESQVLQRRATQVCSSGAGESTVINTSGVFRVGGLRVEALGPTPQLLAELSRSPKNFSCPSLLLLFFSLFLVDFRLVLHRTPVFPWVSWN